jgi:hypothetical protein
MKRENLHLLLGEAIGSEVGAGRSFLWGAVLGFVSGAIAAGLSARRLWLRSREGVREEGRSEERQKLELEITNQRREADLRRREAEARRWEAEDAQAEVQRLRWEMGRIREQGGLSLSERDAKIRALQAALDEIQRRLGA